MKPVIGTTMSRQVAFVGPFSVGKTTAVRAISDSPVLRTEVHSSAAGAATGRHAKETTTVGLDYGEWTGPDGRRVAVVGTPGQARFDSVRQSVTPRSTAIVLWLFGQHPEAVRDCGLWLDFLADEVPLTRLTVAVTRLEQVPQVSIDDFRDVVERHLPTIPLLAADPRVRNDVAMVLRASLRLDALPGAMGFRGVS